MTRNILLNIGRFSETEIGLFEKYAIKRSLNKNDVLLKEGEVCQSVFYILSGSFYQFQTDGTCKNILDLHIQNEWMFNQTSLINQSPSKTSIRAFSKAEVLELDLNSLHKLIATSQAFLQLNRILDRANTRIHFFDYSLSPVQKYNFIMETKPLLLQVFPLKMIASYLKITPETLSRVRANF